jgi:hypothetical protein
MSIHAPPSSNSSGNVRLTCEETDQAECNCDDRECFYETQTDEHLRLQHTFCFRLTSDTFDGAAYDETVTDTSAYGSETKAQTNCDFHVENPPSGTKNIGCLRSVI